MLRNTSLRLDSIMPNERKGLSGTHPKKSQHSYRVDPELKRSMNALINMRTYLLACSLVVILQPSADLRSRTQEHQETARNRPSRSEMANTILTLRLALGKRTSGASSTPSVAPIPGSNMRGPASFGRLGMGA